MQRRREKCEKGTQWTEDDGKEKFCNKKRRRTSIKKDLKKKDLTYLGHIYDIPYFFQQTGETECICIDGKEVTCASND